MTRAPTGDKPRFLMVRKMTFDNPEYCREWAEEMRLCGDTAANMAIELDEQATMYQLDGQGRLGSLRRHQAVIKRQQQHFFEAKARLFDEFAERIEGVAARAAERRAKYGGS